MSDNLRQCLSDLNYLTKIKCAKTRKIFLKYLSKNPKIYLAIKEIAFNVIKGRPKINMKTKYILHRYKKQFCAFADSKKNIQAKTKQKLIVQSGGWIYWLVPIISALF